MEVEVTAVTRREEKLALTVGSQLGDADLPITITAFDRPYTPPHRLSRESARDRLVRRYPFSTPGTIRRASEVFVIEWTQLLLMQLNIEVR